ncbi:MULTISPECIES: BolA family protein [unclassified Agarivorans]|uniref:BolA family protein n=1 Tax=unclassified Agarivorans TaxID=2636026 RepID=UPI003D7C99CA
MRVETQVSEKLKQHFSPEYLAVVNESHMHNVPAGSESHFKVTIVSELFQEKTRIQCHREVNKVLAEELKQDIHALAIHVFTPERWDKQQQVPVSPNCRGG